MPVNLGEWLIFLSVPPMCVDLDAVFVLPASKAIFRKEQSRGNPATQSHGSAEGLPKADGRSAEENPSNTTPVFGFRTGVYFLLLSFLGRGA